MPIIRSQDKEKIVDTNNLFIFKTAIFAKPFEGKSVSLGRYTSENRCRQILTELEAKINGKTEVPEDLYRNTKEAYNAATRLCKNVYQMPEA